MNLPFVASLRTSANSLGRMSTSVTFYSGFLQSKFWFTHVDLFENV